MDCKLALLYENDTASYSKRYAIMILRFEKLVALYTNRTLCEQLELGARQERATTLSARFFRLC